MPTARHSTAQNFHNLIVAYIRGGTSRIHEHAREALTDAGISLGDKITLDTLEAFIQANRHNLNDWAADANHGHTELSSILLIPFRTKAEDGFVPVEDKEEALKKCRALLEMHDNSILPFLSDANRRVLLTHVSEEDFTPLMSAIYTGDAGLAEKVFGWLEHYAPDSIAGQLTAPNKEEFTLLMQAIYTGDAGLAEKVFGWLEHYAPDSIAGQLTAPNKEEFTLLMQAIYTGDAGLAEKVLGWLEKYAPESIAVQLTKPNKEGFTPLMQAIYTGDIEVAEKVLGWLEKYAPESIAGQLTKPNKVGFTPLMTAIHSGNTARVKIVAGALKRTLRAKTLNPHQDTEQENPFYNPDAYKAAWRVANRAGFNLLHSAVTTLNLDVIDEVIRHMREVNLEVVNPRSNPTDNNSAFLNYFQHRLSGRYASDPKANPDGPNLYHVWAAVAQEARDAGNQEKMAKACHTYKHLQQLFERNKNGFVNLLAFYDTNVPPAVNSMADYPNPQGVIPSELFKQIESRIPRAMRQAPHEKGYEARMRE